MHIVKKDLSASGLHLLAMGLMLCDHLWATVIPGNEWLTALGRLAFPIFAFLTVEGYFHTRDLKKYRNRLLIFALLSEVPFNLMMEGSCLNPFRQNVLWTFLIGLGMIYWNETVREKGLWVRGAVALGSAAAGYLLGTLTFVDYHGEGILIVLMFYFLRKRTWWCLLGQILVYLYISEEMIRGYTYEWEIFGHLFAFSRQGLGVLALIPIWLYRGRKGIDSKVFRYFCYGFYPAHMLLLSLLRMP